MLVLKHLAHIQKQFVTFMLHLAKLYTSYKDHIT